MLALLGTTLIHSGNDHGSGRRLDQGSSMGNSAGSWVCWGSKCPKVKVRIFLPYISFYVLFEELSLFPSYQSAARRLSCALSRQKDIRNSIKRVKPSALLQAFHVSRVVSNTLNFPIRKSQKPGRLRNNPTFAIKVPDPFRYHGSLKVRSTRPNSQLALPLPFD